MGKPIANSKCLIYSDLHLSTYLVCSNKHLLLVHLFGQPSYSKHTDDLNADFFRATVTIYSIHDLYTLVIAIEQSKQIINA